MLKTLYFVRHGQFKVPNPRPEASKTKNMNLTISGVEEVMTLARKIEATKDTIELIYCSSYARTLQTAEILAKYFHCQIKIEDRLEESTIGFKNTHHLELVYQAFTECVDKALDNHQISMIVSHRLPISVFMSKELGVPYEEMLKEKKHIDMIKMGKCVKAIFNARKLVSYEFL